MKYKRAYQKNYSLIKSRLMREATTRTTLFGTKPVSFCPVRAVRLMTDTTGQSTGFHVIGILYMSGGEIPLCCELIPAGIDAFWIVENGRLSINDETAAAFNYPLFQMFSPTDGSLTNMVKSVLATWSMDPM